jgi:peptidoglycan hydrolase-like protein with peptidoglycan-binding domain
MKRMNSFGRVFSLLLAAGLISGLPIISSAQDGRPRYSRRAQPGGDAIIPADTVISLRMDTGLSSRRSRVGDRFTATVTLPVHVDGRTAIPAGATVHGHVTQVTAAKRMSKPGTLAIDFDELVFPDGTRMKVAGVLTSDDPRMREQIDDENRVSGRPDARGAVFVGGGGIIGAVLGAVVAGGKGAAVGGVIGAGIGVAGLLLTKGEEADVPPGTPFGLQLRDALVLQGGNVARHPQPSNPDSDVDPSVPRGRDRGRDASSDNATDRDSRRRDTAPERDASRDNAPPRSTSQSDNEIHVNRDQPAGEDASKDEPKDEPVEASLPLSSPDMIKRAQGALRDEGYYEGPIDGAMSPRTSTALKTYQHENNLPETGDLDPETAKKLGILGQKRNASTAGNRNAGDRTADNRATDNRNADRRTSDNSDTDSDTLLATISSATATRVAGGSINILINTVANTGGWRWYGEHVVNGDTLEVYARAVKPTGMVTQVLTRGKIEMVVRDGVQYVRRVVVHGNGGDVIISLDGKTAPSDRRTASPPQTSAKPGSNIQSQAEDLLSRYRQSIGLKPNGSDSDRAQYNEADMEVLFSLESFANAARLYAGLSGSLQDQDSLRSATLALAREARKTDAIMTTTSSRAAQALAVRWDAIRQEVLKLMRVYNISSSDLDN